LPELRALEKYMTPAAERVLTGLGNGLVLERRLVEIRHIVHDDGATGGLQARGW